MNCKRVYDLSDCTEYRQSLMARPPRLVRATIVLLVALIAVAVLWAALTEADLVVRAQGRVRPMILSEQVPDAAAEESRISPLRAGRVDELHVREGDRVEQGGILLRFNTEAIDKDLAKQRQQIRACEQALIEFDETEAILNQRFQTAKGKAQAELTQTKEEIHHSKQQRESAIQLADVDRQLADDELRRVRKLAERGAVTESRLIQAESRSKEAHLKLQQAQLNVDESRLQVMQQALRLVDENHTVECAELDSKREAKRSDLAAARLELAKLEWERRQCTLRAPSDGVVTDLDVRVGDVVEAGRPTMTIAMAEGRGFRIDVTVTSDDVGLLKEGLCVRVKLDAYDYQKYGSVTGRVAFIAPDSEVQIESARSEPPTYTVSVVLDDDQVGLGRHQGRIKLGMTGIAEIITDQERILSLLVRSIRQSVSLG